MIEGDRGHAGFEDLGVRQVSHYLDGRIDTTWANCGTEYHPRYEEQRQVDGQTITTWVYGAVERDELQEDQPRCWSPTVVSHYADGRIQTSGGSALDEPGGPNEEGDYVSGSSGGRGARDRISVDESLMGRRITLSEPASIFGDELDLTGCKLHLEAPLTLAGGATVYADTITGVGIVVRGSYNVLTSRGQRLVMAGIQGDAVTIGGSQGGVHEGRVDGGNQISVHV